MEKDFNKEIPTSDNAPGKNAEDKELSILDEQLLLLAKQRSLQEHLAKLVEEKDKSAKDLASLKKSVSSNEPPQFQTSPSLCAVSPKGSPIQKSQTLSEDAISNPPDSAILTGESRNPDIVYSDHIKVLRKHSEGLSNTLQSLHDRVDYLKELLASHNKTRASGAHTELDSQSETRDKNAGSNACYSGKGKSAVNPKYRYKKGSQNISSCSSSGKEADKSTHKSSCSSLDKDNPAKRSEEALSTSESKSPRHDSQESKVEVKRISPAIKRKVPDNIAKDHYEQQLDECRASTSGLLQFSGNLSDEDEDLETAKKMKLEGVGNISRNYPTPTDLRSKPNHEILQLQQFMTSSSGDCPDLRELLLSKPNYASLDLQQSMTSKERKKFTLPSASRYTSNDEESSVGNESDIVSFSESEDSPMPSVSDMPPTEREESSLTSVSSASPGERGESSLMSESASSLCGNYFLQLIQSEDKSPKAKEETTNDEESP